MNDEDSYASKYISVSFEAARGIYTTAEVNLSSFMILNSFSKKADQTESILRISLYNRQMIFLDSYLKNSFPSYQGIVHCTG